MRDRGGRSGQRQFATLQALEFAAAVGDMYSDNLGACGRLAGTRRVCWPRSWVTLFGWETDIEAVSRVRVELDHYG
jgi:hypothetical protein